ncbi:MAG: geranylgeranylglyceryl/heptaprenylglyceryl phosphate synthase [Bacteroidia bacterium]
MTVEASLYQARQKGEKFVFWLVDPDKLSPEDFVDKASLYTEAGGLYVLVGGSFLSKASMEEWTARVHGRVSVKLILFPGHGAHVARHVDAVLFLMLISGRNPEYLISQQLQAAPILYQWGIEAIPTSYLLVEGGKTAAVHYISQTLPLPQDKPDLVAAVALTGRYMGHRVTYIDAGSGALYPPSPELIGAVRQVIEGPLIVGGGFRRVEEIQKAWQAGADVVVVGTQAEKDPTFWQNLSPHVQMYIR